MRLGWAERIEVQGTSTHQYPSLRLDWQPDLGGGVVSCGGAVARATRVGKLRPESWVDPILINAPVPTGPITLNVGKACRGEWGERP